ncbi:MAG: PqqD family protein [Acutalibacteraceae bacterium]
MKIKSDFLLKKVADSYVVVPVGKATVSFNGMITLNETGAFLWEKLQSECENSDLLSAMLLEYEVDEKTAQKGIDKFINELKEADLLEQ